MTLEIRDITPGDLAMGTWDRIVKESPSGWFWATRAMHEFRVTCFRATGRFVEDLSFICLDGGQPCGLVPLVLGREEERDDLIAAYHDAPLPWPMIVASSENAKVVEVALLDELERRATESKVSAVRLMLAPPNPEAQATSSFHQTVRARSFVDVSYESHWIEVNANTLSKVRERYRRDVRKHAPDYAVSILGANDLFEGIAELYMDLHVKDSGRVWRPLPTYERQMDLVRRGEGFWVMAHSKAANRVTGMLLISLFKGAAYDNSVAVDPEFTGDLVSHLMKWRAIEHLLELGVRHYELGIAATAPSYFSQPTPKNYGISFFKDGWSRGRTKTVLLAEKFYAREPFERFWQKKGAAVAAHFGI